ncbi:hypothetical protein IP70_13265 [alpha proteobacterium AAP38]|nr:hypothetical protein IP70_13265 [alpha proteobacterium AAP38]
MSDTVLSEARIAGWRQAIQEDIQVNYSLAMAISIFRIQEAATALSWLNKAGASISHPALTYARSRLLEATGQHAAARAMKLPADALPGAIVEWCRLHRDSPGIPVAIALDVHEQAIMELGTEEWTATSRALLTVEMGCLRWRLNQQAEAIKDWGLLLGDAALPAFASTPELLTAMVKGMHLLGQSGHWNLALKGMTRALKAVVEVSIPDQQFFNLAVKLIRDAYRLAPDQCPSGALAGFFPLLRPSEAMSVEQLLWFSSSFFTSGYLELADQAAMIAADKAPDRADIKGTLANILLARGQLAEAIAFLSEVVAAHPGELLLLGRLAAVLFIAGRHEEAAGAFQQCAALPGSATLRARTLAEYGLFLIATGKDSRGVEVCQAAVDLDASPLTRAHLGYALFAAGQFEEAVMVLDCAVAQAGPSPAALLSRGLLRLSRGEAGDDFAVIQERFPPYMIRLAAWQRPRHLEMARHHINALTLDQISLAM